jgi:hypothetical protein
MRSVMLCEHLPLVSEIREAVSMNGPNQEQSARFQCQQHRDEERMWK